MKKAFLICACLLLAVGVGYSFQSGSVSVQPHELKVAPPMESMMIADQSFKCITENHIQTPLSNEQLLLLLKGANGLHKDYVRGMNLTSSNRMTVENNEIVDKNTTETGQKVSFDGSIITVTSNNDVTICRELVPTGEFLP